ncbi:MAG TPA: ComF family protein [Bacillota bacterium]|nr:ComF family protein [Bacillota bacterium]
MLNVLNLLFPLPLKCGFCDRREYKNGMCKQCMKEIEEIKGNICERCGRPLETMSICVDCHRRKDTYFVCNRSAVRYNEKMKSMISLYKYRGQEKLVLSFARLLEQAYRKYYNHISFDCLTYVPIHEQRLKERGFNQAQQMAFYLSLRIKIPVKRLLIRTRYADKQSKKQRQDRINALTNSFELHPYQAPLKRVLLIDDIYTTGSTVNECAKILVNEGIQVYSLTVGR